jgi:WD40-like Beta Propeller Repeat
VRGLSFIFVFLISYLSLAQDERYVVANLKINDERPHFSIDYFDSDKVIFTSYLLNSRGKIKILFGNPILTVFEAKITEGGQIINEIPLKIDPKETMSHVTSACLSPNSKQLYITTKYTDKNKPKGNFNDENFHIEVGEYDVAIGWTNFKVLSFCDPKYSYGHPALSKDGKTLYLIANIRGGKETTKGASDIFKVDILGNNKFSEPKNLGIKVNSYSKEMFPFMSDDNTLYFASNRPNGIGGFDIYKSKSNADGTFEKAEKLPEPINSKDDDFCFIIDFNNKTGYFSSKREEGKGEDDIYYFVKN